jgi:hypothetical protein
MSEEPDRKSHTFTWSVCGVLFAVVLYFLSYPWIEDWLPPGLFEMYSRPWAIVTSKWPEPMHSYRVWVRRELGYHDLHVNF